MKLKKEATRKEDISPIRTSIYVVKTAEEGSKISEGKTKYYK